MLFIAGPRQCGKTTVAKSILSQKEKNNSKTTYLNWDIEQDRAQILSKEFPSGEGTLVLDEIHKYLRWRDLLKGLFDARSHEMRILVTGSAKLDYYRRGGDSLQGRYNLLRMHPLSVKELNVKSQDSLRQLFELGGFPEPFISNDKNEARRWSNQYRIRLIREELVSLEKVSELSLLEELSFRLPDCVGSVLSINSLKEDLRVSHQTLSRWLILLDRLYSIFRVNPFGAPRIKAVKKESKHYHWDWNVVSAEGARFENLIASHLLKWCNWIEDVEGHHMELRFFRDREQREVDFVILKNNKPIEFVECKYSRQNVDPSLSYLKRKFPEVKATQVCMEPCEDLENKDRIRICDALTYLWDKT